MNKRTGPATTIIKYLLLLAALGFSGAIFPAEKKEETTAAASTVSASPGSASPITPQVPEAMTPEAMTPEATASEVIPSNQANPVTPFYQNNGAAPEIGSSRHLLSVTVGLITIVALIFALSWFAKRFNHGGFSSNNHLKIISAMPLGTRERVVLMDAGGQQLLIGVTATTINTLHVFDTPIMTATTSDKPSDFSQKLMAILQQKPLNTNGQKINNSDNNA